MSRKILLIAAAILTLGVMLCLCGCSGGDDIAPTTDTTATKPTDNTSTGAATGPQTSTQQPQPGQETAGPTEGTKPTQKPTEPVTPTTPSAPDPSVPETTEPAPTPGGRLTYEEYMALSAAEQTAYRESFESTKAFFDWYNAARAEYDAKDPPIDVDGSIDMGDLIGGN